MDASSRIVRHLFESRLDHTTDSMKAREATDLLRPAVDGRAGTWADFGAGSGTFTRALAELLGAGSRIFAVDRDRAALRALKDVLGVTVVTADFTRPLDLPGVDELDGLLFANALHFVEDAGDTLTRLSRKLRAGGRVVVVEYDGRGPSRWVPFPLPAARWPEVARAAHLHSPAVRARRRSAYGGDLYVATADRD
jgi:SAM-dependent methyltransferase